MSEFGDKYTFDVRQVYDERISHFSDLVVYWFEKSRALIESSNVKRAGLIATNSIGMGAN